MVIGPILSGRQLIIATLGFHTSWTSSHVVLTGAFDNVDAHVSAAVCLDAWSHRVTACVAPARWTDGVRAAHAPTAPRPTSPHARRSQFQLHSRPPRQRLPSSLVIESASALPSACTRSFRAAALPMNASDYTRVILSVPVLQLLWRGPRIGREVSRSTISQAALRTSVELAA